MPTRMAPILKMSRPFEQLWDPRGVTRRRVYLAWGFGLMALKFNLDRIIAGTFFGYYWSWPNYWMPFGTSFDHLTVRQLKFVGVMLISALPFIGAGVVLTMRRLRDANWPRWFVAFFFFPVLNLVLFASLVAIPGRSTARRGAHEEPRCPRRRG